MATLLAKLGLALVANLPTFLKAAQALGDYLREARLRREQAAKDARNQAALEAAQAGLDRPKDPAP